MLNGETLDQNQIKSDPKADDLKPSIFMLFNSKDERESYDFMERDPVF